MNPDLLIVLLCIAIAAVAIAHALDVRRKHAELFKHCVELAKANGALMLQRDALLSEANRKEVA